MLTLRPLQLSDEDSFRSALAEFEVEVPKFDFAFQFKESSSFEDYLDKVESWKQGIDNLVPASYLVAVVDSEIVGRVSIRHELNDFLKLYGGHVGYAVIPSKRRKGYATEILKQALSICAELGLEKIMISCDVGNEASKKVIERNAGVYVRDTTLDDIDIQKHIYFIETNSNH